MKTEDDRKKWIRSGWLKHPKNTAEIRNKQILFLHDPTNNQQYIEKKIMTAIYGPSPTKRKQEIVHPHLSAVARVRGPFVSHSTTTWG